MGKLEAALAEELAIEFGDKPEPMRPQRYVDPLVAEATRHRNALAGHRRKKLEIVRDRDLRLRALEGDLAEAERTWEEARERLERAIVTTTESARRRLATRDALIRSSEAALAALEPNKAEREAPMEERRIPRAVHAGIKT